jgi:DNA-binding transcriptional ArsR family regulator
VTLNVERLRLDKREDALASRPARKDPPRHRPGEFFLKGPIPLTWIQAATQQPGKAVIVALELWFRAGVAKNRTVRISLTNLQVAPKLSRSAASRGLASLEKAGLVTVVRASGRKPVVTLQDTTPGEKGS